MCVVIIIVVLLSLSLLCYYHFIFPIFLMWVCVDCFHCYHCYHCFHCYHCLVFSEISCVSVCVWIVKGRFVFPIFAAAPCFSISSFKSLWPHSYFTWKEKEASFQIFLFRYSKKRTQVDYSFELVHWRRQCFTCFEPLKNFKHIPLIISSSLGLDSNDFFKDFSSTSRSWDTARMPKFLKSIFLGYPVPYIKPFLNCFWGQVFGVKTQNYDKI